MTWNGDRTNRRPVELSAPAIRRADTGRKIFEPQSHRGHREENTEKRMVFREERNAYSLNPRIDFSSFLLCVLCDSVVQILCLAPRCSAPLYSGESNQRCSNVGRD